MRRLRAWVPCLLALLAGCTDGGPVGTGIGSLSAISGNVVAVDGGGAQARKATAVPRVHVSIDEVAGLETVTDEDGNFELAGDFSGAVTLRFVTPEVTATTRVDVPQDADLVLQDIVVAPGDVLYAAARVIGFLGKVALVDCADGTLLVNDRRPAPSQFLVRITDDTVLVRPDGVPVHCTDIVLGNVVAVEGAVRFADRTIIAFTLTVDPPPPGSRPLITEVRFRGTVVVVSCQGNMLLLDDAAIGRTRLRLSERTAISGPTGESIDCDAIQVHDHAEGRGLINVRRPEVVEALVLLVQPPR